MKKKISMKKTDNKNLDSEILELEKEYTEVSSKLHDIHDKIINLQLKKYALNDLEGKFIKYQRDDSIVDYMLVDWVYEQHITSCSFEKTFRGIGFSYEFTGYYDATWCEFDFMKEFTISNNSEKEFKEEIDKIKIITKEEFELAFNEMINNMKNQFNKKFKKNE